jgi:hypothetical protein
LIALPSGLIVGMIHTSNPSGMAAESRTCSTISMPACSSPWIEPTASTTLPPGVPSR